MSLMRLVKIWINKIISKTFYYFSYICKSFKK